MRPTEQLVNQIVAAVLERIGTARVAPAERETTTIPIDEPVITAAVLEKQVADNTPIVIGPRAIITPSARDYIRHNNIILSRGEQPSQPTQNKNQTIWRAFVVQSTDAVTQALGTTWQSALANSTPDAAGAAIDAICRAEADGVVVFADAADAVACLANRNDRVRAAAVRDMNDIDNLKQQLGPNVWVIRPSGRSFIELRNLLRGLSANKPVLPAGWNT